MALKNYPFWDALLTRETLVIGGLVLLNCLEILCFYRIPAAWHWAKEGFCAFILTAEGLRAAKIYFQIKHRGQ